MRIVLLGNYERDRQESMQRFASVLRRELPGRGLAVTLLRPQSALGRFGTPHRGLGKWTGYVDKLILFPLQLRRQLRSWKRSRTVVHICDQANAIYAPLLREIPHVVTGCDLLAIRCARGEIPGQTTRWSGRHFQRMILDGLNQSRRITCISEATRRDVLRLTTVDPQAVDVTPMGLNYPYAPLSEEIARARLSGLSDSTSKPLGIRPYLLHVGGNQWYKNRLGVLQIYRSLVTARPDAPDLVMAGKKFTSEMSSFVRAHDLQHRVIAIESVTNDQLGALYSAAALFLFPSLAEGFGWPIVEAQACGCPVVTTNQAPMTEVGGEAAFYVDPTVPTLAARGIMDALDEVGSRRAERIARGMQNAGRFSTSRMIERYCEIYRELIAAVPSPDSSSEPYHANPARCSIG